MHDEECHVDTAVRPSGATLGGAAITGGTSWDGTWSALPADPGTTLGLTVRASSAAIVRIPGRG